MRSRGNDDDDDDDHDDDRMEGRVHFESCTGFEADEEEDDAAAGVEVGGEVVALSWQLLLLFVLDGFPLRLLLLLPLPPPLTVLLLLLLE